MEELLEALEICEKEDRSFIEDELFSLIIHEKKHLHDDKPQWWRIRWGFENARSDEHYMECYTIWQDKLKQGTLYV